MNSLGLMLNFFKKEKKLDSFYYKKSYSQSGEDLIIDFIFEQLKIKTPTFLDIGAHHPFYINNTYYFYLKGSRGVNIEPDPSLIHTFKQFRDNDINLNVGLGFKEKEEVADFYMMTAKTLNTFSKDEAERIQNYGTYKIDNVIQVKLVPVNTIFENFFSVTPNFVSIDIEGLDYNVIKEIDFGKYRPEVLCVETLSYTENKTEKKQYEIIDYMLEKGYFVYADTFINTVFVNRESWEKR